MLRFIPCSPLLDLWSQLPRLCGTMKEQEANLEQGCSRRPQAADVLSQASSSAGFVRLPGSWTPMEGITLKRKVI